MSYIGSKDLSPPWVDLVAVFPAIANSTVLLRNNGANEGVAWGDNDTPPAGSGMFMPATRDDTIVVGAHLWVRALTSGSAVAVYKVS
jgi:hypothetical protein